MENGSSCLVKDSDMLSFLEETVNEEDAEEEAFLQGCEEEAVNRMMKRLEMEICVLFPGPCASVNGCLGHSDSAAAMSTTSSLLSHSTDSGSYMNVPQSETVVLDELDILQEWSSADTVDVGALDLDIGLDLDFDESEYLAYDIGLFCDVSEKYSSECR